MRVVLDTNVLISCCWKPGRNEWRILELVRAGALTACVSSALLAEYREVAERKKFANCRECLREVVRLLEERASRVEPAVACAVCSDEDDNRLLECALAAEAAYVITGNLRHFPGEWEEVRVVNARTFLDAHPFG